MTVRLAVLQKPLSRGGGPRGNRCRVGLLRERRRDQFGIEDLAFRVRVHGVRPKDARGRRGAVPVDHRDARLAGDRSKR
jgi:hypothetical protein